MANKVPSSFTAFPEDQPTTSDTGRGELPQETLLPVVFFRQKTSLQPVITPDFSRYKSHNRQNWRQ